MQEMYGVEITKTIADSIHYGKQQMKAENTKLKRALELEIGLDLSLARTNLITDLLIRLINEKLKDFIDQ